MILDKSITQEMFSELYFYRWLLSNLSSLIKNQVDDEIGITADSSNKFRYQANRTFIIGRIKKTLPKILCRISDLLCIDDLQDEAVKCRSQIMPGRSYKRKKLRMKGRTHFNNLKVAF